ncbi:MAG: S8 family serine peptidase [Ignavibacteria bacterium]
MKIRLILLVLIFITFAGFKPSDNNQLKVITNGDLIYSSNEIIIKFQSDFDDEINRIQLISSLLKIFDQISIKSIDPIFNDSKNKFFKAQTGLDRIYSIKYDGNADPLLIAKKISNLDGIEYAEPRYIYRVDYTPNDPSLLSQSYLNQVKAQQAWDVSKGDSSVVIGIIDTGVYWMHPDLNSNIWINKNEIPYNGIDDDNNGYVDDIRGWDFGGLNGTPDNDPQEDAPYHGTHVAGIASASTDNGIGVAGMGFKCKIMAVKTARDDQKDPGSNSPYIWYGYEGIVYAADNGAKVINCSWGGGGFSQFAQDVINYATTKGALIVAAAGNSNSSSDFYPASYKNVLSVAAVNSDDRKASYSNYGYSVDVNAPGTALYNTWGSNSYAQLTGTSMASPLVAGIAGLVRAKYPFLTPEQAAEKIRVGCDDNYNVNTSYRYMLGKGRVNAWRALQDSINTSVRMLSYQLSDNAPLGNGNEILEANEQAEIKIVFKNILNSTSNLNITLTSLTSGISVINGSFNAGTKSSGEVFNNYTAPFKIQASSSISYDLNVRLLLNFSDGTYSDWQIINFIANPSYTVLNNGSVSITIGSKGNLAFNDYPTNSQGQGFKYKTSSNLLFEGALIIGTSSTKISDVARNQTGNAQNQDFTIISPIKSFFPGTVSDLQSLSIFNDDGAGANKIGVKVILNSYEYSSNPYTDFVILHYKFINTTSTQITNFYAGLFFDWDLINNSGLDDVAKWDAVNKMGYVYNQPGTTPYYVGSALLSHNNYHFRAILNAGGDGGWGIYDGFTDTEKWEAISGGVSKTQAGAGDVSFVVSGGPYTINPNDTLNVAFAVLAGNNLSHLQSNLSYAKQKWSQIITGIDEDETMVYDYELYQNFPNPFNPETRIKYSVKERSFVQIKLFDMMGREVATLVNEFKDTGLYEVKLDAGNLGLSSGIYFYQMKAGEFTAIKKMIYLK